jgi:hypothetical protein
VITAQSVVRPEALDYIAGLSLDPTQMPPEASWPAIPVAARRLEHVRGVGFNEMLADKEQASAFATEAVLAGLAGETIPFAFRVFGGPDGVRFTVGTWGTADDAGLDQQQDVLISLLDGVYPSVDRAGGDAAADELALLPLGGLAYGVPSAVVRDGDAPWDRLLRALQGASFAVVVLAEPVEPASIAQLRDIALDDLRAALSATDARELPLTRAYGLQIEELVASLNRGLTIGSWRTGVYLLGDAASYWRLAAAWRGLFSAAERPLSPLRVVPSPDAGRLAAGWAIPYQPAPAGPRLWRHPFLNQTLLDTRQLASIAHFPRRDTPGFSVRPAPAFAVSRDAPSNPTRSVAVGDVLSQQRKTGTLYRVELDQLTRHAFVTGLTGSGKTNTVMHLLMQAAGADIPFLVIEPAKTEYREMLGHEGLAGKLRVFTLGREQVAPLRINPFEVPEGIDVSTHLDLLKAVFMGSFALWIPLPQILEQCLVELYTERGWDFTTGEHRGGRSEVAPDVPTIGELVAAVERTVPKLGYKTESTQEITASLTTRLNGLRRGTRGLMLDVERSIPISELLSAPTIIELEGIGDDADKAFVMGLLLVRLYEHRRAENSARLAAAAAARQPAPSGNPLSHIIVVEEAHRLLSAAKKLVDAWHADPQGAFADAFSQMLSEVRAYGQGMIIADQVPVRLAPDVLKNTNLKIVHRLVAGDDREAMSRSMSMSDEQSKVLSTLPRGRAVVFSEGDHTPVVVAVPKAKDLGVGIAVDDATIAEAMRKWRSRPEIAPYFEDNLFCSGVCRSSGECRKARELAESPAGRLLGTRLLNTAVADADGLDVVWPDIVAFVSSRTRYGVELPARVHAFAVHALHTVISRRATQARWPADAVDAFTLALRDAVAERVRSEDLWLGATAARRATMKAAAELMRRSHDPYPLCSSVCPDGTCRYRDSLIDVLTDPRHAAFPADVAGQADPKKYIIELAGYAANDVIALDAAAPSGSQALSEARWRAVGCAAQVKFCATDHPGDAADLVASALSAAGLQVSRRAVASAAPTAEVSS